MGGAFYQGIPHVELEAAERRLPPDPDDVLPAPRALFRQLQLLVRDAAQHINDR